jgi:hypothetical protein
VAAIFFSPGGDLVVTSSDVFLRASRFVKFSIQESPSGIEEQTSVAPAQGASERRHIENEQDESQKRFLTFPS